MNSMNSRNFVQSETGICVDGVTITNKSDKERGCGSH